MKGKVNKVSVDYDPNGALVTTHRSQGSDMGLFGGLLGWDADDVRLPEYDRFIKAANIEININYLDYGAKHPNTYRLHLESDTAKHTIEAISTGGGMIELTAINDMALHSYGDRYILLTQTAPKFESSNQIEIRQLAEHHFAVLSPSPLSPVQLSQHPDAIVLKPVVPVCMNEHAALPFNDFEGLQHYLDTHNSNLPQAAIAYESALSGKPQNQILAMAEKILDVMEQGIEAGKKGTDYHDRILPSQVVNFQTLNKEGRLIGDGCLNDIITAVTAFLEVKSSMGTIVAAPTAGSCGVVPGALIGVAKQMSATPQQKLDALLTAGLIGLFIAQGATFAAEEGGCMAECGSASGMACAGLVILAGGTTEQALGAASMALQNSFGMTCDPIANRVEAPCLGKNVMAASNALSCANMAMAGFLHLVPLNEVIKAMDQVGKDLPRELCCTALGGLSICETSKNIEKQLAENVISITNLS
jgi:L-serine dehydratase